MSILYVVATPIGNLEDISQRALRILSEVDLILCEDTRVTRTLLERYGIKTPTLSYHQHSKIGKIEKILSFFKQGKNLALVSDAGTPGISDPGNKLIELAVKELGNNLKVIPIAGPSALAAAASIAGFSMDKFIFLGFPPIKKRRKKFFEGVVNSPYPVVFYESPYRIMKTLKELGDIAPRLPTIVCRELTKKFETIYRGEIGGIIGQIKKEEIKGEFVVIVKGK